jgi:CHAT domain-containing protein
LTELLRRHGVDQVALDRCTWRAVMNLLERGGYTWLHAAAHGDFDGSDVGREALLHLENGKALTTADVVGPSIEQHVGTVRPAFVFNACHAGRLGWGLTDLAGWADHLVSLGAGMVLGPFWAVRDDTAETLAQGFYEALLAGATVAEALQHARRAARRDDDPSWLAYSLHAHPNARLALTARPETRRPKTGGPGDEFT